MYLIYSLVLTIIGIVLSPIILVFFILQPKLRAGFWQKIGFYPELSGNKPTIWFHAVSVGEVNAVEGLIKKFRQTYPDSNIVLTTVTRTGQEVANNKLSKVATTITYFPYDFDFSVKSAIRAINPDIVVVAETEIWPNFSHEINRKNIPLLIVNGRISPNSYKGYKKFSFFFKYILKNYTLILMQTEEDRKRIVDIGAKQDITKVMGNLKFDFTGILNQDEISDLKNSLKLENNRIFIVGSTHSGEDEIVLDVFKNLKKDFEDLKLILAPRHPERNNQVLKLIAETGFNYGQRSKNDNFSSNDIILLDVMGELSKLYSISHLAFIGGSFSNTGGHNPLEPAVYGIPVLSGSTVFNFKDIYKYMTETNAAKLVNDKNELYQEIYVLLTNTECYNLMSQNCLSIFETNKGALDFSLNKIGEFIK